MWRGPGDRDAERCGRGCSSHAAETSALLHEPKIPSGDTEGQKTLGENAFGISGMDDFP